MGPQTSLPERPKALARTPFGHEMLKHFLFDPNYRNLNHGSFGTYPASVRDVRRRLHEQCEARPDVYIRYEYPKLLDESRALIAQYLNADTDEVVFVSNATTGVNTVLRNLVFQEGDYIVYFDTIYGACEKTVEYIVETTPAKSAKVQYTYPLNDADLVQRFKDLVRSIKARGDRVKVAVLDTIVSMPGVRVPFEALVEACKEEGVLSLIDGAHGVGQIPIDLGKIQPDFFVSNCHKWLYTPRGCAVFYVPFRNQKLMRSTIPTSHGFVPLPSSKTLINNPLPLTAKSAFVYQFQFTGTVDDSPYVCIPAALKFRKEVCGDEDAIYSYIQEIANKGAAIVAKALGTEVLENSEGTLQRCALTNVRLPLEVGEGEGKVRAEHGYDVAMYLTSTMAAEFNTFMATHFYAGAWWIRFSGQIYLDESDFEFAAGVLKELCQRVKAGAYLKN